jgi:hypothetical protein
MSLKSERTTSKSTVDRAQGRWVLLALVMLAALTFFLRCVHLFDKDYFYIY